MKKFYPINYYMTFPLTMSYRVSMMTEIVRRATDIDVGPLKIRREASVTSTVHSKEIRADVLAENEDYVISMEMQNAREKNMVNRDDVYHHNIMSEALQKGDSYAKLPHYISVFICMKDPFNAGSPVYYGSEEWYDYDEDRISDLPCIPHNYDKIILNLEAAEKLKDTNPALYRFAMYTRDQIMFEDDELIVQLDEAVHEVNKEARTMNMLNYANYFEEERQEIEIKERLEGKLEGIREGKLEGMKETVMKLFGKNMTADQISALLDMDIRAVREIISKGAKTVS